MILSFPGCSVERIEGNRWCATGAHGVQAEFTIDPDLDTEDRDDLAALEAAATRALAGEDAG